MTTLQYNAMGCACGFVDRFNGLHIVQAFFSGRLGFGVGTYAVGEVFGFQLEVHWFFSTTGDVYVRGACDAGEADAGVVVCGTEFERAFVAVDAEEAGHVGAVGASERGDDSGGHLNGEVEGLLDLCEAAA